MFIHYIILSSSYSQGERIALDFVNLSTNESMKIIQLIDKIEHECGKEVPISFHCVKAQKEDWASVGDADPFFKNVKLIASQDEFISLIKKDRKLKGLDVAKYILSVVDKCTHLKLEKLVYLCYADYLCATSGKKKLFEDEILAYRYGPVVKSVYENYKIYAAEPIDEKELPERKLMLSAKSRILFSEDGLKKLNSILDTLEKYKDFNAGALIDLTHRSNTPWSHCDSNLSNYPINDELIIKYHCNES